MYDCIRVLLLLLLLVVTMMLLMSVLVGLCMSQDFCCMVDSESFAAVRMAAAMRTND